MLSTLSITETGAVAGCRLRLERDALLRVRAPAGLQVAAESGLLWVTQDGQPEDRMLAAGDVMQLAQAATLTVSALHEATLRLRADRPLQRTWRRAWSALLVQADGQRLRLAPDGAGP